MITTGGALVAVALGSTCVAVDVGRGVPVAVGAPGLGVSVCVSVGRGVRVGKADGGGSVGNGVNVGKSKSNKAVGVGCAPSVGKTLGVGAVLEALRPGNKLNVIEQRQQNTNKNSAGISILPVCPCRL